MSRFDATPKRIEELPTLPTRRPEGHKGDYGRVLVVGGSLGMVGAPALAANAALRSGAGLVRMALPDVIQQTVAPLAPCATSDALPSDAQGRLSIEGRTRLLEIFEFQDVAAIGTGMGVSPDLQSLILAILDVRKPTVIDADGLNNLAAISDWATHCHGELVLTPHPGEMRRLTGVASPPSKPSAREAWARRLARACGAVVVLKGHRTVVCDPRHVYVNQTGNPGMATGGSGDVLTGAIAALLGQGLAPFEAAVLGAHVHGLAGDLAARERGQLGLIASDLVDKLPEAFLILEERGGVS